MEERNDGNRNIDWTPKKKRNTRKMVLQSALIVIAVFVCTLMIFPVFAEGATYELSNFVSNCAAESLAAKGSFGSTCNDITGAYLENNEGTAEQHAFNKNLYAGVRIQSVNTSTTNCIGIEDVFICYEWWHSGPRVAADCDVSVDADGGGSYTAVTTTCPGTTTNPGVVCTNVTGIGESWNCENFLGPTGTKAFAKSEYDRTNAGPSGTQTAYWDILYYNITYLTDDPPTTYLESPENGNISASKHISFTCNATDDIKLTNITFYWNYTGTLQANGTVNVGGTFNETTFLRENLNNGNISWNCLACDNRSQCEFAGANYNVLVNFTPGANPSSNSPADQTVELGNDTTIEWAITDTDSPNGTYYVTRNGTVVLGPRTWFNNTPIIGIPNTFFLGTWNYTIYYNDSSGNIGTSDTVLITVNDDVVPTCDEIEERTEHAISRNITVDGDMSDWDAVLANPNNVISDPPSGAGDLDVVTTADRDFINFAFTWDDDYLYFYFARVNSGTNIVSALVYLDYDNDGYMNNTDQVVKFVWFGSGGLYDSDLYNYIPAVGTADLINGSGYDMPGSISINKSIENNVPGGTHPGIKLETRVLWSDLSLSGPSPILLRPASAISSGTNLPSQIEDNLDQNSAFNFSDIIFWPDNVEASANGTSVYYAHNLINCGPNQELIDFTNVSSQGWNVTLYYPNGTIITDTDANNLPDVTLDTNDYTPIIVKIDIPGDTAFGTTDTTTITANNSNEHTVTDTTVVAAIAILPISDAIFGTPGITVTRDYLVGNFLGLSDIIEISATSSLGWNYTLQYLNGTIITDTDGDSSPDVGTVLPNEYVPIQLVYQIPSNATLESKDIATLLINSSNFPAQTATATSNMTVKKRIVLEIGYNRSASIGDSTYYYLTVYNNWNDTDVIDISYSTLFNWNVTFFELDQATLLSDTDSDGIVDVGSIGSYGASYSFYARVIVPANASDGDSDLITIYANSSLDPTSHDNVTINTTARILVTYKEASRVTEQDTFEVGDTVYARASALFTINNVYFEWIDPENVVQRTSSTIPVTSEDNADDDFITNSSHLLGNWTVIVFNDQNNDELGRTIFYLVDLNPPSVVIIQPSPGDTYNFSDNVNVTITANVTDNYNLSFVYFNITYPNGTTVNFSMINTTGDLFEFNFTDTTQIGQYNITIIANDSSNNINDSETTYFIIRDDIDPAIALNYPPNNFTTSISSINFTWTATDNYDAVLSCNLTINGTVNASNIASTNGVPTNYTVSGFSAGDYYWNVTCWDDAYNINTSETWNFTIVPQTVVSFTLTLPGQAPVQCNSTPPYPNTASMELNSSNGTELNVDPCVVGTGVCQNSTVPFFIFTNTGSVNLSWAINLNQSFSSVFRLKANTIYNGTNSTNVTTTAFNLSSNVGVSQNSSGFFFGDFFSAAVSDNTFRDLQHQSGQYP